MATTLLQLTNQVLVLLREPEVDTVTATAYSKLIVALINHAKREVEDAHLWSHLKTTAIINTEADESQYTVVGLNERAAPMYDNCGNISAYNYTENGTQMQLLPAVEMSKRYAQDPNTTGKPYWFDFDGVSSDNDLIVEFWPKPDGVYEIRIDMYDAQADLVNDVDVIKVPPAPVVLRALAMAVSERGEDGGAGYQEMDERARRALSDAIQLDYNVRRTELRVEVV